MKTRKNRHTRNRTSRRRMKGGGHEEDVALIRKFLVPIPADLIAANEGQKYQLEALSKVLDGIVPRESDIAKFAKMLKEYPIPPALGQRLQATLTEINTAKIRRPGTLGQPFLLSLAQRFQSELAEILPIVIATPPARKANIDWFPSLQKLHRISKDYAISREPTQGARINAKFERVDTASKKDTRDKRQDEAERKLLESIGEFSSGTLSTWFDQVKRLVDVPSMLREQAIADIWKIVPPGMPPGLTAELHSIFDRHTAFLSAKEFDAPLAAPLAAPEAKPSRPGRKVYVPPTSSDEPVPAAAAPPLPASPPGTPSLRGELQADPKELPALSPSGPAPGLGIPESVELAPPVARHAYKTSKPAITPAPVAATPGLSPLAPSDTDTAPPIVSPPSQARVAPDYTSAAVPLPTDVERGAAPAPSGREPLPARGDDAEVVVHEPLLDSAEAQAAPPRLPVRQPGLLEGLTSMLPNFLSSPAPASEVRAAPPQPAVSQPGRAAIPEYTAQPGPSTASQLPLPPPTRFNPLDRKFTPPAFKPYNPFQSYPVPPLASVTSAPFASPGTYAPFSFLAPGTQTLDAAGLTTQETPISGLYANEKEFGTKSLCERLHPKLYQILKTGQFNGKSITTLLNEPGPELQAFFAEIKFDVAAKTLMGHPITEIYKACHPDRTIADPNLTTIFQTLQALYNYTGAVEPVQSIADKIRGKPVESIPDEIKSKPAENIIYLKAAAPLEAPGLKPERPDKKAPPIGDLTQVFKRGDTLVPKRKVVHRDTGKPVILTVMGDYDASNGTIKVGDGKNVFNPPVDALVKDFKVLPQEALPTRLLKVGDRVLIKYPVDINSYLPALREDAQSGVCNYPFYATVEIDEPPKIPGVPSYVNIICDKGGRYRAEVNDLQYVGPKTRLVLRSPGEAPPQPTPVVPLEQDVTPQRRGQLADTRPSFVQPPPASVSDCEGRLHIMTDRAKTCEENLTRVKAELEAALAAHAAETAKLQGDLGASKEALRRMEGVKNGLESDLARTNRALATIRDMLGEQSRKLGTLNTRYEALDKQKVKLEGQLASEQGKSAGLEGQLASKTQANAEEQGRLRASIADITGKLGQVTDERGLLQGEIDRQRGELEVLERKAADLEAQFASTKALIVQKGDEIRRDLAQSVAHIDSGLNIIHEGVDDVAELVREAKEDIAKSRVAFGSQMNALQRELEQKNLQGRQEVLANIGALRAENQQALGALNAGLAAALAESARLNELLRTETAAKAQAEGALQAAQAAAQAAAASQARELAAAREASDRAFAEFKAATEAASAEERQRLTAEAHIATERLRTALLEQQAIAVASANEAARRQVEAQLAALRDQIAALPPPYVPPPPLPPQPIPIITGRTPAGVIAPGSNIQIQWDPRGTAGPWILKIIYDGGNPDFKDIQVAGDIPYKVKQPGALAGQIFSIV